MFIFKISRWLCVWHSVLLTHTKGDLFCLLCVGLLLCVLFGPLFHMVILCCGFTFVSVGPVYSNCCFPICDCKKVTGDTWGWGGHISGLLEASSEDSAWPHLLVSPRSQTPPSPWAQLRLGGYGEAGVMGRPMAGPLGAGCPPSLSFLKQPEFCHLNISCSLRSHLVFYQLCEYLVFQICFCHLSGFGVGWELEWVVLPPCSHPFLDELDHSSNFSVVNIVKH